MKDNVYEFGVHANVAVRKIPVTFESPEVVKRVLELRYKHGLGYRRIASMLGMSSHNVAWRICKNFERGLIMLNPDGTVRFNEKPRGRHKDAG